MILKRFSRDWTIVGIFVTFRNFWPLQIQCHAQSRNDVELNLSLSRKLKRLKTLCHIAWLKSQHFAIHIKIAKINVIGEFFEHDVTSILHPSWMPTLLYSVWQMLQSYYCLELLWIKNFPNAPKYPSNFLSQYMKACKTIMNVLYVISTFVLFLRRATAI